MKKTHFLKMVQHRAARVAVTASATRGQGADVVDCARTFLVGLKLARFGTHNPRDFARQLDADTERLRACLPKRAARWGLARKLLNIFLRDSLYTSYLARQHGLVAAERLLEVPLDSITAKRILRREAPALALPLPRWQGVRHLDPDTSAAYQEAALVIARQRGIARVHLDADWWGARKSEEALPTAAEKAARTRTRRAAGRKAAVTRQRRAAGRKAAVTRRRRAAGRKAAAARQAKARR